MIKIDGSYGEGGGQILRTSLSLAAITTQPVRFQHLRAKRKTPGLAAQHLTSVRAAAAICQAKVKGDALGSTELEFIPGSPICAGNYTFEVNTAGAIMLILQTVLLPLALAPGNSTVILRGGTHVEFSPPFQYIEQVYLRALADMGIQANVQLNAWGWYPKGGGEVELQVTGNTHITAINLLKRGYFQQVRGVAAVTNLPAHIPQRMAARAENLLREAHLTGKVQPLRETGMGAGAGIFLTADYEYISAGFSSIGRLGVPAEKVAEKAVEELLDFHRSGAPVDVHLADQLLLPAALASENSQYRAAEISLHLKTNAWVIEKFGLARIRIDEGEKVVEIAPLP